jgi:hypothetical protein
VDSSQKIAKRLVGTDALPALRGTTESKESMQSDSEQSQEDEMMFKDNAVMEVYSKKPSENDSTTINAPMPSRL